MTSEEEIQYLKEQVKLYRFDWLTGLKGRRDFDYDLRKKFTTHEFWLVYYDVDNLHRTNREKGFAEGDKLIRQVAGDIQHQAVPHTSYRTSGDEFYAMCCQVATLEVENSTSVAVNSAMFDTIDDMLEELDKAMILAKTVKKTRRQDD